jgi:thymidylate synthase (FAD)
MEARMTVKLLYFMGNDDLVVDAARVSFRMTAARYTAERNHRLIKYLASHGHWTPFAHPQATFLIQAPIFVARQLHKHQVGLVVNEVSRRYVSDEVTLSVPIWREASEDKKQGSGGWVSDDVALSAERIFNETTDKALLAYYNLLKLGIAPEQARAVLPLATHTQWVWTGSLYAWSRVCRLRLAPDAQKETAQEVEEIDQQMAGLFPVSWAALGRA